MCFDKIGTKQVIIDVQILKNKVGSVTARMLYAGYTDAGHNSTFGLMPRVYISHKIVTIFWTIKFKLPASSTRAIVSYVLTHQTKATSNKLMQNLPKKAFIKQYFT